MTSDSRARMTKIGHLIARIKAGEPGTREELLEVCYDRFMTIARNMLDSEEFNDLRDRGIGTVDVFHQTLVDRIFKKNKSGKDMIDRQDFDDPNEFIGAVANHIRFCLKDIVRGRGGAAIREANQKSNPPSTDGMQAQDHLQAPFDSGSDEHDLSLAEAIDQLDEKIRQVFKFRYLAGLSRKETAEALGISIKYVTRHAQQGREQLAKLLGKPVSFWKRNRRGNHHQGSGEDPSDT